MATTSQKMILNAGEALSQFGTHTGANDEDADSPNQVLCGDSRCADTCAQNGRSCDEDAPASMVMESVMCHFLVHSPSWIHHPAPTTLKPMQRPIPSIPHEYGLVCSRNAPMLNACPEPVRCLGDSGYTTSDPVAHQHLRRTRDDSLPC